MTERELKDWTKKYVCPKVQHPCLKFYYRCTRATEEKCRYEQEIKQKENKND